MAGCGGLILLPSFVPAQTRESQLSLVSESDEKKNEGEREKKSCGSTRSLKKLWWSARSKFE